MRAITIIRTWHVPIEQVSVRDRQRGEFPSFVHDRVQSLVSNHRLDDYMDQLELRGGLFEVYEPG